MGGSIFTKGPNPLFTPRMPRQVYTYLRDSVCHAALREIFPVVASPIDGPDKVDFGDVDVAVAWLSNDEGAGEVEKKGNGKEGGGGMEEEKENKDWLGLAAAAISGVRVQRVNGSDSEVHVAVPWPERFAHLVPDAVPAASGPAQSSNTAASEHSNGTNNTPDPSTPRQPTPSTSTHPEKNLSGTAKAYIQVDIHIFPNLPSLQWSLFKHSHGDLWGILGSVIRPYGLTADEVGLYLRIPEIERHDHKRAKVWLTSEPEVVLKFLGMESGGDVWARPFETKEAFFEYAASTRLFRGKVVADGDGNGAGAGVHQIQHARDEAELQQHVDVAECVNREPSHPGEQPSTITTQDSLTSTTAEPGIAQTTTVTTTSEHLEESTKSLRSGERRRMKYRPLFAEFMEKYFPEHHHSQQGLHSLLYDDASAPEPTPTEGRVAPPTAEHKDGDGTSGQHMHTRDSIREEAFTQFGPSVRQVYNTRLRDWKIEKQRIKIKRELIKGIVPPASASTAQAPPPSASISLATMKENNSDKMPPTEVNNPHNELAAQDANDHDHVREEEQEIPFNPSFRGQIVSALSKIVLDADYSLGIIPRGPLVDPETGLYLEDEIERFVREIWRDVARSLMAKNAVAFREKRKGVAA